MTCKKCGSNNVNVQMEGRRKEVYYTGYCLAG